MCSVFSLEKPFYVSEYNNIKTIQVNYVFIFFLFKFIFLNNLIIVFASVLEVSINGYFKTTSICIRVNFSLGMLTGIYTYINE